MISWYMDSSCITGPATSDGPEEFLRLAHAVGECVDLSKGVVDVEGRAGAGLRAQSAVQRPGTVVAGPHGDAELVQDLSDVMRVNALDDERHRAAAAVRAHRAQDRYPVDVAECCQRVRCQCLLVRRDAGHAQDRKSTRL